MGSFRIRILRMTILGVLLFQLILSPQVIALDSSDIGVEVDQQFDGYVVFVKINESGVTGIYGKSTGSIAVGDYTSSSTIQSINNETGEITIFHTNYGLPGWNSTYRLSFMCAEVIYTDWGYWHETLSIDNITTHKFETETYFGYVSRGNGSYTEGGITTPTTHRQDCIYNKETGFREFFALYQEKLYDDRIEVIYQVQQFLLANDERRTNASLYYELAGYVPNAPLPIIPPTVETTSSSQIPSDTSTQSSTRFQTSVNSSTVTTELTIETNATQDDNQMSPILVVNYPLQVSILFGVVIFLARRRKRA